MIKNSRVLRVFAITFGSLLWLGIGASPVLACGGDGERACCGITGEGATCAPGLTEITGCSGSCFCGTFLGIDVYANSHCYRATPCGGDGQRACCGGELVNGVSSCQDGMIEIDGCDGACTCGGTANPDGNSSSGHCVRPTHCGGDGERACCIGTFEYASGTSDLCEPGKTTVSGCVGDCQCGGGTAVGGVNSLDTCVTATHCGGENERGCCLSERSNACDDGLTNITGCTGDCFCKGGTSSSTCIRLDGDGKLPLIAQPGTGRTAAPSAPRSCALRGYADLHVHMFSDTAHGGGVFGGAAWDPLNDDVNSALRPDYGTHRNLVTTTGGELPTAGCPTWIRDCGEKPFHGDHVFLVDDAVGSGTGDVSTGPLGAPNFNNWPTWHTTTHQQVYYKWLERAYQGGLRLMSMLAVTNEALCLSNKHYRGVNCADSMGAIDQQLADAVAFETFVDNHSGGPGQGWFRIVRTPAEARQAIADGKLAVVLGIEVDNLFNCHWADRDDTTGDCSAAGIAERVNHYYALGVRHVFPIHNFNNAFGGPATWQDAIDVGNRASEGHWWSPESPTNPTPGIIDCSDAGYRFKLSCVMQELIQLLGFPDSVIALTDPVPCSSTAGATCNPIGLTQRGKDLVNALMSKGMLIDIDHMSNRSIEDTLTLARQHSPEYPLLASHVQFFDLNQSSQRHERMRTLAQLRAIRDGGGMIAAMLKDDGQDALGGKDGKVNVAYTTSPSGVAIPDNCRHSSKTFAQMYQYAVDVMGGPVALGSDFNGVAGHIGPRFGPDACGGQISEWAPEFRSGNRLPYPFDLASIGEPGFGSFGKQASGGKTFDYNVDGLAHIGLLPDMVADLARVGLPQSYLDAMFGSAEQYIGVWERAAGIAAGTGATGGAPVAYCEERTVDADATCHGTASIASDANQANDALTLTQDPAGPYVLGTTHVTLHVSSDQSCLTDSCTAAVTVRDVTGPAMTCPTVASVECSAPSTPVSFGTATSVDNCSIATSDGCSEASGSGFPVGSTTVDCRSHDAAQNPGKCSFTVRVTDTVRPSITCPTAVSVECQANQQATATFGAPSAHDACSSVSPSCSPSSGSSFPLGINAVGCSGTDATGNTGTCTTSVTVADTAPPIISCQTPQVLECTGNRGATGAATASASDVCFGTLTPTCPSSAFYPLGSTPVRCSAQDGVGLPASCATSITVQDTTAPTISCPAARTLECTGSNGARATVTATGSDVCWGTLSPSCAPAATNYLYPLGTTSITCFETDGSGLPAQCPTSVRVTDTTRPTVSSSAAMDIIDLPTGPNHTMVDVGYASSASDVCNGALSVTVKVYANEDDETPTGDGVFSPDALGIGSSRTLRLRYERVGSGKGRVYLIVSKATDSTGNVGASCHTVVVAASQTKASLNALQATANSVRTACIAGNGAVPSNYFVVGDGAVMGTKQ